MVMLLSAEALFARREVICAAKSLVATQSRKGNKFHQLGGRHRGGVQERSSFVLVRGLTSSSSQQADDKKGQSSSSTEQARAMRSIGMPWTRQLSSTSLKPSSQTTSSKTVTADDGTAEASKGMMGRSRRYHWVDEEAEKLIAVAYRLHLPDRPFPPSVGFDTARLEGMRALPHFEPKTLSDRVALRVVKVMEQFMHLFFREKYDHHAVTLETVAAVPGFLAAVHRHMRSLRRMKRDHGWIDALLEEATNERMHLLIWMQMTQPNAIERMFVLFAQGAYIAAYSSLYFVSPKTAHRSVGYLEEAAFRAYTDYLKAVDSGAIPNRPLAASSIAKKFYRLPEGATLRDVILHVRADEAFHALYNHAVSTQIHEGRVDEGIVAPGEQEVERASQQNNATGSH